MKNQWNLIVGVLLHIIISTGSVSRVASQAASFYVWLEISIVAQATYDSIIEQRSLKNRRGNRLPRR